MPAPAPEIVASSPADFARLTRTQKIAMLLVVLGEDTAISFLRVLQPDELESISAEMAKVGMLSIEMQNTVLKEFTDVAIHASTSLRGGFDFTQSMLEKALGIYKAATVISRDHRLPIERKAEA